MSKYLFEVFGSYDDKFNKHHFFSFGVYVSQELANQKIRELKLKHSNYSFSVKRFMGWD